MGKRRIMLASAGLENSTKERLSLRLMTIILNTAVQGLLSRCYSWARGYHSWTGEHRHPVHVTDVCAAESQTPLVRELSVDRFSVGLLVHCSSPTFCWLAGCKLC